MDRGGNDKELPEVHLQKQYGPSHAEEHVPKAYRWALGTGAQSGGSLVSLPASSLF